MNKALIVILAAVTLDAIGIGLIFPILPRLLEDVTHQGDVTTLIGIMLPLYSAMQFLFSPVLGVLSDRYGRRPVLLVSLAGAAIDYLVEWQSRESRLKMSKQDQRDEHKEMEGNPHIKGRIKSLQRQMRKRKVKNDVSKAAVVLTNPTHYAVALGFDFGTMEAPKVVAKGRNLLAEEIKGEARWAGVPIIENPPLARSLYKSVEVGQDIPVDLYAAVAAILAYLYRQRVEGELRERRAREAAAKAAQAKRPVNPPTRGGTQ